MKKYFLITLLSILNFSIPLYAQDSGSISKRSIEKDKKKDTKTKYNYLLFDAVNNSDEAYAKYENIVQQVWDKKSDVNLTEVKTEILEEITEYQVVIKDTPAYLGGEEYKHAVLAYIGAVKDKIESLEKLGILGATENADVEAYYKALYDFNDVTNEAIKLRNAVRMKKSSYEKIYYLEK